MTFKHVNIAADTVNKCFPDKNTIMALNSNLQINRNDILPVSLCLAGAGHDMVLIQAARGKHSVSPRARPRDFFLRPKKSGAGYPQAISRPSFK